MIIRIITLFFVLFISVFMAVRGSGLTQFLGIVWCFSVMGIYYCVHKNYSRVHFADTWIISVLFFVSDHFFNLTTIINRNASEAMISLFALLEVVAILVTYIGIIYFGLKGLFNFFTVMQCICIDIKSLLNMNFNQIMNFTNNFDCNFHNESRCIHDWDTASWGGMNRFRCEKCGVKGEIDHNIDDIVPVSDWSRKHYLFGFIPLD